MNAEVDTAEERAAKEQIKGLISWLKELNDLEDASTDLNLIRAPVSAVVIGADAAACSKLASLVASCGFEGDIQHHTLRYPVAILRGRSRLMAVVEGSVDLSRYEELKDTVDRSFMALKYRAAFQSSKMVGTSFKVVNHWVEL